MCTNCNIDPLLRSHLTTAYEMHACVNPALMNMRTGAAAAPNARHAQLPAAVSHSIVARQRSRTGPRREQNPSAPRSSGAVWKGVRNTCAVPPWVRVRVRASQQMHVE